MWGALTAVLTTLEAMADSRARPTIHVASLDCGVGKTQAMLAFLRALLASPAHAAVSVLVCIERLSEIKTLAEEAGLPSDSYAAFVADRTGLHEEINSLGCADPTRARILFSTHAMLQRRCDGRSFGDVPAFYYKGRPRDVRIYDEAILPGRTFTVSRREVMALSWAMGRISPGLANALDVLQRSLSEPQDKTQIVIPDLSNEHRVDLTTALAAVKGENLTSSVDALWHLFGRVVSVRLDGAAGNTLLEYKDTLSPDIAPLLVLDASARVRTTYDLWEDHRKGIEWLPTAPKDYHPLTVHVWPAGGGKDTFRRRGAERVEAIAKMINSKPNETWLVIHHINIGRDIPKEILASVSNPDNVSFLNWGRHNASNRFKHVRNVILAGTPFPPKSYIEALTRLASSHPSENGRVRDADLDAVERGEYSHAILQAICRSAVRQCVGTSCPAADAYVIAHPRSGIDGDMLHDIFPGCSVVPWLPITTTKRGKAEMALKFIRDAFSNGADEVLFADVKKHIGVADAGNFSNKVRKKIDSALKAQGVIEWPAVRPSRFKVASAAYFGNIKEP